jgi:glycosyltransferase involved in cell wall biosynthesis
MIKPVILVFNVFYIPGYKAGGPIRTLVNMVDRLGDEFDFRIVTTDRDFGEECPYTNITYGEWHKVGKAQVRYLSKKERSLVCLKRIIDDIHPDLIYLNSFLSPVFTQKVLILRFLRRLPSIPIILAPRGEFSAGALNLKRFKKWAYIKSVNLTGLCKGVMWQASSESEKSDISRALPKVPSLSIFVAMNLAPAFSEPVTGSLQKKSSAPLRICFLGRISPMKNLDYALKVLHDVEVPVLLSIYGPASDIDYYEECKAISERLPSNVVTNWNGPLDPADVQAELANHDLFFMPTRGENYGHVIHEALMAGLPVLTSDQTPWREIQKKGIGWTLSLSDPAEFSSVINDISRWDCAMRNLISNNARRYACSVCNDDEILKANRRLFYNMLQVTPVADVR